MMNKNILKHGLLNAALTAVYILLVVTVISNFEAIFGGEEPKDNMLIPVVMLITFVVSAAITGTLVLGRPLMWFLDGKRREAVMLLGTTLALLALIALGIVLVIL